MITFEGTDVWGGLPYATVEAYCVGSVERLELAAAMELTPEETATYVFVPPTNATAAALPSDLCYP